MTSSDEHLEESLQEYNDKIAELEKGGSSEELLEALTNRSTILMLLESYVSSITDADDALEICEELESEGKIVDPGIKIKIYENRGQLRYDTDVDQMVADYSEIVKLLDSVGDSTKHYPYKEMMMMCIDCASDLIDKDKYDMALPFILKAEKIANGKEDVWSENRKVEIFNLHGQILRGKIEHPDARSFFEKSIRVAETLGENNEDDMEIAFSYINIGDICEIDNDIDGMIEHHEKAIVILSKMNDEGKLDDTKILVDLHQGVATELMEKGKVEEAERHLMATMKLGMPSMAKTMEELGIKKKD